MGHGWTRSAANKPWAYPFCRRSQRLNAFSRTIRSILLVEDDSNYALLVQLAFESAGVTNPVRAVSDGETAVAYLSGLAPYQDRGRFPLPGLVIIDIKLTGQSGFDVLQWMRAHREFDRLPVVILTASTDPEHEVRAYQLGAKFYMHKPRRMQELVATARALADLWLGVRMQRRRTAGSGDSA